jgi:hypothetical protein
MFVGHAMLAFAVVGAAASTAGVDRERAFALGVTAAAFATVPDVDILYALSGVLRVGLVGLWSTVDAFWSTGNVVHRSVTHSLVLGVPASVGFALATHRRGRPAALAVFAALVGWVFQVGGVLPALVATASFGAGVVVALLAARELDLGPAAVLAAAGFGWLSHPFGDLFTGEPPAMLYPVDVTLFEARLSLHPDPTLHLLSAFGIELATIWLATLVYARLHGIQMRGHLDRRATLGVCYAVAAFLLPAPTMAVSYHFVLTVLAFAAVGLLAGRKPWTRADDRLPATLTALAAVSFASVAYATAYLVV